MKVFIVVCAVLGVFSFPTRASVVVVTNVVTNGTLATTYGASIMDRDVARWIEESIPTNSKKLIILTQCFGGNMVDKFATISNTTVISATSPGQKSKYGYYDKGASMALKPGPSRTAQDVHNEGFASKHTNETPIIGGTLSPTNFSLDPVSPTGTVKSRHIVFYAGEPDSRPERDFDQYLRIKKSFETETNTTLESAGGQLSISNILDFVGNAASLRRVITNAAAAITNSPTPDDEQFVFYVTDHGDYHVTADVRTNLPPMSTLTISNFPSFRSNAITPKAILEDAHAVPSFSIFIPFTNVVHPANEPLSHYVPYFSSFGFQLQVFDATNDVTPLNTFNFSLEQAWELNGSGFIGDFPGEGIVRRFTMDPSVFVSNYFDRTLTFRLTSLVSGTWMIQRISQDSGELSKLFEPLVESIERVFSGFVVRWSGYRPVRLEFTPNLVPPTAWMPLTFYQAGGGVTHSFYFEPTNDLGFIRAAEQ
ncbi:MAG: hypothetical protein NZ740_08030 [Kiritimatiellae bacterium]|nr:hypothetical protein [Kiritimatiellia bacterium]MDW8459042.1 hypothetical protein [Verrucomicrobiota bacterium]